MILSLPSERIRELDVYLYVLGLVRFLDRGDPGQDSITFALMIINDQQHWFRKPKWEKHHIASILEYGQHIDKWEWYVYLRQKGYTNKQIADILNVKNTTVKAFLHGGRIPKQEKMTLERWVSRNDETFTDLYGVRETPKIEELVIPPFDFASVLRQSL